MIVAHGAVLRRILWPTDRRRRILAISVGALVVVAAAYAVLWSIAAGALEARFRSAVAAYANDDLMVSHGEIRRSGFPGALRLDVAEPSYAYRWKRDDGSIATLTWYDSHMAVRASPFRPSVLRLDWPKQAVIEVESPDGVAQEPVSLRAETARVDVWLTDGRALPVQGELRHVSALNGFEGTMAELLERFSFTGDYGDGADRPSAAWRFEAVNLAGVDLETGRLLPHDAPDQARINRMSGAIDVFGPLPEPTSNAAMAAWRDAGGRIELRDGQVESPKLGADVRGTLALDGEMRPLSRIDMTVNGLGRAVEQGQVSLLGDGGDGESLLVVLLGLLSGQDDPNGPIELHFETRDGRAFLGSALGSIRIGKVGPIDFEAENGPLVPFNLRF